MKTSFGKNLLISHFLLFLFIIISYFLGGFDEEELLWGTLFLILHLPLLFLLKKQPISYLWGYMIGIFLIISLKSLLGLIGFEVMGGLLGSTMLIFGGYMKLQEQKTEEILSSIRLSREQIESVIREIDNYDLVKAFQMIDELGIQTPEYQRFKQVFILDKHQVDYLPQLKIWLRSLG